MQYLIGQIVVLAMAESLNRARSRLVEATNSKVDFITIIIDVLKFFP